MRKTLAAILLLVCFPANAINRQDLIDCLRGQQPEGIVCPMQ